MPPLPRICVYLCKYTYECAENFTFPSYKFGKGQYAFYPIKLSRFAEKNEDRQKYHNFIGGDRYELGRRPL